MKLILLVLCISSLLCGCESEHAPEYFYQAEVCQGKGEYEKANMYLNMVIEERPLLRKAYLSRGANKAALNDFKGAIEDYRKVIAIDPDNTLAHYNIANNYANLGKLERALEFYRKALCHSDRDRGLLRIDMPSTPNILMEFDSDFQLAGYEINLGIALVEFDLGNYEESKSRITDPLNTGYAIDLCNLIYAKCLINQDSIPAACSFLDLSRRLNNDEAHLLYARHCINED